MNGRFLKKNVVIVAVVIGALFVSGALVFNKYQNSETATTETLRVNKDLEGIATQTVAVDSDGDGLKDWEEALLGTDPQNPDSDSDGTTDKDEVNQNRDPLVAGPNDTILNNEPAESEPTTSSTGDKTITEDLAIKLFTGYIELKKGKNLSTASSEELISTIINETVKDTSVKTYSVQDIVVIKNPGKEVISEYDSRLKGILTPNPAMENDVVVLKRILETNNKDGLNTFDTSLEYYGKIVSEMLLLNVPEPISGEHIMAINALIKVMENVRGMKTAFTDPLKALISIKEYDINERIFVGNLLTIGKYLDSNRL